MAYERTTRDRRLPRATPTPRTRSGHDGGDGAAEPADQPLSLALYEVAVAEARDPHHDVMITDLCGEQVRLYERLLDDGLRRADFGRETSTHRIAETFIALEDGSGGLCTGNTTTTSTRRCDSCSGGSASGPQAPELVAPMPSNPSRRTWSEPRSTPHGDYGGVQSGRRSRSGSLRGPVPCRGWPGVTSATSSAGSAAGGGPASSCRPPRRCSCRPPTRPRARCRSGRRRPPPCR